MRGATPPPAVGWTLKGRLSLCNDLSDRLAGRLPRNHSPLVRTAHHSFRSKSFMPADYAGMGLYGKSRMLLTRQR